ncbi:DNA-processing protein DprA [Paenibacillus sp. IHBB 10380]|uniref:DNA-processing protein DprA n=1 Tax=Paenibacillus sp. IHBB 10380 TaxID=1566358 RepID=UPI0018FF5683|nr:DNA-processing protein DprA [Paenibacillus sp. IHBB 10380]
MGEREILIALHELDGIGSKSIERLINKGALSAHMLHFNEQDWEQAGLPRDKVGSVMRQLSLDRIEQRSLELMNRKIKVITILDEEYPALLKEAHQPPWVLYCLGNVDLLQSTAISMVGTRIPTAYGRKVGAVLAEGLCKAGMTVISGLARGIDSVCHEASLICGGNTIAVMATGMDVIYPAENRTLYERIAAKGLIVTEYALGTPSHPGLFPQRNRIIAGLSLGTLVVEADARSGSLITADLAMEAGRDVYAVPGPITSPKSRGTLELIKQGAKMVTCTQDVLEEYESHLLEVGNNQEDLKKLRIEERLCSQKEDLTTEEIQLYHILEQGPCTLDQLLLKSQWDFGHLHSVLLSLIIKKQITQLAGAIYKII